MPARAASSCRVRRTSLAPAGFLIRRMESDPEPTGIVSTRPNAAAPSASPERMQSRIDAEPPGGGDRAQRVVDVVEARQRQLDAQIAPRRVRPEGGSLDAVQLDIGRVDVGGGAVRAAVRARVMAEMADERPLVAIGGAAAPAVLGVEGVLELRNRLRRILDPEERDPVATPQVTVASEVGDQGVVGVEDEAHRALALGDDARPLVGELLELAVSIELIAEEVPEQQQGGGELVDHLRQPCLVDLEQALGAALLEQRCGDSPGHVRAGPIVDRVAPGRVEGGCEHARRSSSSRSWH